MDDADVVAGVVKQLIGRGLFGHKVRRDQGKITRAQSPQQIVERPVAGIRHWSRSRGHFKVPMFSLSR
jgi:hypothetical protein